MPSPCPSSCRTTVTKSILVAGGLAPDRSTTRSETGTLSDGAIEFSADIVVGRIQVAPRQAIGQGLRIPGVSARRPAKSRRTVLGPAGPSIADVIAKQRIESAPTLIACHSQKSTPDVRGELKGNQPLDAQGGASVPPVRESGSGALGSLNPSPGLSRLTTVIVAAAWTKRAAPSAVIRKAIANRNVRVSLGTA